MTNDDAMKLVAIMVSSLFSTLALVISWLSFKQSGKNYEERKLLLHQKLYMLRAYARQFHTHYKTLKNIPMSGKYHIPHRTDALKQFALSKTEQFEFAFIDLKYNPKNTLMIGLPNRIKKWFSQKTVQVYPKSKEESLEMTLEEMHSKSKIVNGLVKDLNICISCLEKEMSYQFKYYFLNKAFQDWYRMHIDNFKLWFKKKYGKEI